MKIQNVQTEFEDSTGDFEKKKVYEIVIWTCLSKSSSSYEWKLVVSC